MSTYWSAQVRRYDRAALLLNRRTPDVARAAAAALSGAGDVLEVAAGTGLLSQALAQAVGHLVATDQDAAMRAALEQRLADRDNTTIQAADALALPFEAARFDAVVIGNLLHLLPSPADALREARRVLRPGGLLAAPTFCHGQGWRAAATSRLLAASGLPVVTRFRGDDLDEAIAASGFTVRSARWFPGLLPIRLVVATADDAP